MSEPASGPTEGGEARDMGERHFAEHNVMAVYPTVELARAAVTALERKGVEGGNIELLGAGAEGASEPQTNVEQRKADLAMTGAVGRRSLAGLLIGAAIGAVVVAGLALLIDAIVEIGEAPAVLIGGALGGALFGVMGGFFYGGATALPTSDAWGETFEMVKQGRTGVAVHSREPDQVEDAIAALRDTGAERLLRFGADGRTRDA